MGQKQSKSEALQQAAGSSSSTETAGMFQPKVTSSTAKSTTSTSTPFDDLSSELCILYGCTYEYVYLKLQHSVVCLR